MMYVVEIVEEQKIQFYEKYYNAVACVRELNLQGYGIVDIKREQLKIDIF